MPKNIGLVVGAICVSLVAVIGCDRAPDASAQRIDNPYAEADTAYRKQDFATARDLYRLAATRGDAVGQYKLGLMYYWGHGVPQSHLIALEWLRKSAEQGNAEGQYNVGQLFLNGEGVARDPGKASQWLHLAAAQGHRKAQASLDRIAGETPHLMSAATAN